MPDALVTAGIAFVTVVALALSVVTFVAWKRDRRPRFAFLALAFALFAVKGILLSLGLWRGEDAVRLLASGSALDAGFLAVLYVALVKR